MTQERIVVPDGQNWRDSQEAQICPLCRVRLDEAVSAALDAATGGHDPPWEWAQENDRGEDSPLTEPTIDIQIKEQ